MNVAKEQRGSWYWLLVLCAVLALVFLVTCRGQKLVLVEVTPYEGYYANAPDEYLKKTRERRIQDLSECE